MGREAGETEFAEITVMEKRLRDLMKRMGDWPPAAQEEAIASLESIAGYVSLHEPSQEDR
jgi:hypothetical protein